MSIGLCAIFVASGIWLEAMIGLRVSGWVDHPLQREFLRLGHAHGGILSILNIGLGWGLHRLQTPDGWARRIRLAGLFGAVLVGLGFFVAGLTHGPTDPGPTILIVPAGALLLVMSLAATALVRPGDIEIPSPPDVD